MNNFTQKIVLFVFLALSSVGICAQGNNPMVAKAQQDAKNQVSANVAAKKAIAETRASAMAVEVQAQKAVEAVAKAKIDADIYKAAALATENQAKIAVAAAAKTKADADISAAAAAATSVQAKVLAQAAAKAKADMDIANAAAKDTDAKAKVAAAAAAKAKAAADKSAAAALKAKNDADLSVAAALKTKMEADKLKTSARVASTAYNHFHNCQVSCYPRRSGGLFCIHGHANIHKEKYQKGADLSNTITKRAENSASMLSNGARLRLSGSGRYQWDEPKSAVKHRVRGWNRQAEALLPRRNPYAVGRGWARCRRFSGC